MCQDCAKKSSIRGVRLRDGVDFSTVLCGQGPDMVFKMRPSTIQGRAPAVRCRAMDGAPGWHTPLHPLAAPALVPPLRAVVAPRFPSGRWWR